MTHRILIALVSLAAACGEPLSKSDRDFAMSHLHASRKLFLDAIAGLSEAQWRYKPSPDRWSVAECAEHIILSEDLLFELATVKVMQSPAQPAKRSPSRDADDKLIQRIVSRDQKGQAPEPLKPTNKWPDPRAAAAECNKKRDRTIDHVEKTEADLRSHFAGSPVGELDAYQYLLLLSAHTERHVAQINEVKSGQGYPLK